MTINHVASRNMEHEMSPKGNMTTLREKLESWVEGGLQYILFMNALVYDMRHHEQALSMVTLLMSEVFGLDAKERDGENTTALLSKSPSAAILELPFAIYASTIVKRVLDAEKQDPSESIKGDEGGKKESKDVWGKHIFDFVKMAENSRLSGVT